MRIRLPSGATQRAQSARPERSRLPRPDGRAATLRFLFFSSRRRHTRFDCDWSSDVCSSDLLAREADGDARRALQALEAAAEYLAGSSTARDRPVPPINASIISDALQKRFAK